jgi:hypothetical protein
MRPSHLDPEAWQYVFNSPLECGLRAVAVLLEVYPEKVDLQRLVYYDYLLVHSADVTDGPQSLHPAVPHRAGEIAVRRALVRRGVELMMMKSLICRDYTDRGIVYYGGEEAAAFADMLTSPYVAMLRDRSSWIVSRFGGMSDVDLSGFIQHNSSRWGAEFVFESLVREGDEL